jgi:4-diphosphocytidyl-2-C-methyl-D-erythritol kinase
MGTESGRFLSFAKVNLHLQVVGRRPDGYHELRTVFQTVDLADELDIELGPAGVRLEVAGARLPAGPANLAYRAAEGYLERWGGGRGASLRLRKRIPVGAGLGGGSSNAAAVLLGLQELLDSPADPAELWQLARGLGADVPYFLVGGTALGVGRGDELVPLPDLPERTLVLALPPLEILTREVFADLGELTGAPLDPRMGSLVQRGELGWEALAWCVNDLETPVFRRWPELARLHRKLLEAGAVAARLSGSGTALWAVFAGEPVLEPRRLAVDCRLESVRTVSRATLLAGRAVGGRPVTGERAQGPRV